MNKYFFIAVSIIVLYSCSGNNTQSNPTSEPSSKKPDSFFPVTSFIRGQIITLDSLPVTPLQITTIKGKTDSAWIQKNELKPLLQTFLNPVITETSLTRHFYETKFNDQTLNAVTFTYDPINKIPDSISLRHWDVYVNPETGKVTKVYMVKETNENNDHITWQLTWQSNKMAKIVTILQKQDGSAELLKEVSLIWDFSAH